MCCLVRHSQCEINSSQGFPFHLVFFLSFFFPLLILLLKLSGSFFFFFSAETLMDTKWATTELAWTSHPETGVSYYCCVWLWLTWEHIMLIWSTPSVKIKYEVNLKKKKNFTFHPNIKKKKMNWSVCRALQETPQYSEELAFFLNCRRFWA